MNLQATLVGRLNPLKSLYRMPFDKNQESQLTKPETIVRVIGNAYRRTTLEEVLDLHIPQENCLGMLLPLSHRSESHNKVVSLLRLISGGQPSLIMADEMGAAASAREIWIGAMSGTGVATVLPGKSYNNLVIVDLSLSPEDYTLDENKWFCVIVNESNLKEALKWIAKARTTASKEGIVFLKQAAFINSDSFSFIEGIRAVDDLGKAGALVHNYSGDVQNAIEKLDKEIDIINMED